MHKKTCIIICGATASGKTSAAIELAKHFSTEIISADSRQCFKELNIGVAKPSAEELISIPHHFINSHSIHQQVTAADFEQYALAAAAEIFKTKDVLVMAGGTGLYINAFVQGMDHIPVIEAGIRLEINEEFSQKGMQWLTTELQQHDPLFVAKGEMQNPHRMMRALEVMLSTGKSILSFQKKIYKERNFNILQFEMDIEREILYERINQRVEAMMDQGLLDEVKYLYPYRHLNALQTVGYRELFEFIDGKISLKKAVELVKQNTRHYAKRQITWFRKSPDITWVKSGMLQSVKDKMG